MKRGAAQALIMMLVLGLAAKASGQTAQERADEALRRTVPPTGLLTDPTMQDVVVPFETTNPEATSVNQFNMEDRAFDAQYQNTEEARAYGAMKDSVLVRPEVSLGNDPLSLADDAVEQASSVVGGLFSADEGSCAEIFEGGQYNGYQLCTRILARRKDVCAESRSVTVDREDQWRCTLEASSYNKRCQQPVSWSCSGITGYSCVRQAITYSHPVTWAATSGNVAATGTVSFPAKTGSVCTLHRDIFTITTKDQVSLTAFLVQNLKFSGVAQIRVNGVNLWTHGTTNSGDLTVGTRNCGKNCNVAAVYSADGTWIADCASAAQNVNLGANLLTAYTPPVAGPVVLTGTRPTLTLGKTGTLSVEILRANTADTGGAVATISKQYACCSAMTASVGSSCP